MRVIKSNIKEYALAGASVNEMLLDSGYNEPEILNILIMAMSMVLIGVEEDEREGILKELARVVKKNMEIFDKLVEVGGLGG